LRSAAVGVTGASALIGQAGISDHLLPIFIDHFTILAINKMRWSGRSGEGWSKPAFHPLKPI